MKLYSDSNLDRTKVYREVAPHQYVEVTGIEGWCALHPTLSGVLVLSLAIIVVLGCTLLLG